MNIPNAINTQDLQEILDNRKANKKALISKILDDFDLDMTLENYHQAKKTIERNQRLGYVDQNYTVANKLDYELEEQEARDKAMDFIDSFFNKVINQPQSLKDLIQQAIDDNSDMFEESCACIVVNGKMYQLQLKFICEALLDYFLMTHKVPSDLLHLASSSRPLTLSQQEKIMDFLGEDKNFMKFCIARKDHEA